MYFLEDSEDIINGRNSGRISMTNLQYEMLKNLYEIVGDYDSDQNRLMSDEEIYKDPKWHKVREYAKKVYDELTKD